MILNIQELISSYWFLDTDCRFLLGQGCVVLLVIAVVLGAQVSCIWARKRGVRKGAEMEFLVSTFGLPNLLLGQHQ